LIHQSQCCGGADSNVFSVNRRRLRAALLASPCRCQRVSLVASDAWDCFAHSLARLVVVIVGYARPRARIACDPAGLSRERKARISGPDALRAWGRDCCICSHGDPQLRLGSKAGRMDLAARSNWVAKVDNAYPHFRRQDACMRWTCHIETAVSSRCQQ
jgi:hypothetical protein